MMLHNKVIFLTGGSAGIGATCAKVYIQEGAQVAIISNNKEELTALSTSITEKHLAIFCDVSDEEQVKYAIEETLVYFGKIDAVHNNAGIAHPSKALDETTPDEWDRLINVNLKSIYYTTKYGIQALKDTKGTILNTSSLVGEIGQQLHAAYAATKGAINALTKSMALDYASFGIRVNAVSPAAVMTPMLEKWASEQPNAHEIQQYLQDIHALGYCPTADVIADACTFLLSEKARFITGCILPVSGGAELGYRR